MSPVTAAVIAWLRTPEGCAPWSAALDRRLLHQAQAHPEQLAPCVEVLVAGAAPRRCAQMRIALTMLLWSGVLKDRAAVAKALTLTAEALLLSPGASWTVQLREEQGPDWEDVSAAVTTWLAALAAVVHGAGQPRPDSPLRRLIGRAT